MQPIAVFEYLIFTNILFGIGLLGLIINRSNIIKILLSLEVILLAVASNFIIFGYYWHDSLGQIFVLFIIAIAATKVAIALMLIILLFKNKQNLAIDLMHTLQG